ncbi:MAG TPA: hypothetical protein ENJ12_05005 [Thiolapillus brandeum]|uniref:Fe/B12 periplasmic-binding domain-containing protein n=1 Tax=Thiolapillus brandeum TaxID=1076588 RepID=A0A831WCS9_9GAMM|nr:hypothetical protein [Thiolapillus brandeum]
MRRFLKPALLLVFVLISSSVCAQIKVQDDLGRSVVLPAAAKRIVTLSPHTTEMLLAIGATPQIIAAAQFFDYPDVMRDIPKTSTLGGLDREWLLASNPDLVVAWASGIRPGDLQWLQASGIPVFMSEPGSLSAIADALKKLGILTGHAEKGQKAAALFTARLDAACSGRSGDPYDSVYYEIWPSPPMTIGGKHWLNEVLELAHLHNVFASVPRGVFTVSAESLLATPSRIVITSQPAQERLNTSASIITADSTLGRPGPRIVEGLEQLCQQL